MTREEYENKIKEKIFDIKSEFNNKLLELHKELLSEFKEEKPSLDEWKVGDAYFYNKQGSIIGTTVCYSDNKDDICDFDMFMIKHGYAKHTTEEVRFQMERDAVLYELSKFAEPKDREWDGEVWHYHIVWNYWTKAVCIACNYQNKHSDIYFASKEDAKKAIAAVGEQRIRKYYLMVGDDE